MRASASVAIGALPPLAMSNSLRRRCAQQKAILRSLARSIIATLECSFQWATGVGLSRGAEGERTFGRNARTTSDFYAIGNFALCLGRCH